MLLVLIYLINIPNIIGLRFCKNTSDLPKDFKIDDSFTIDPIYLDGKAYTSFKIADRIMSRNERTMYGGYSYYNNTLYCPTNFMIPKKEDYENILNKLGNKAYEVLTDKNGFNMTEGLHYLTTTRGTLDQYFSFYLMYLDGKEIKIEDFRASSLNHITIRCILKVPDAKIEFPGVNSDFDLNTPYTITNTGKYFDGYIWRIDDDDFFYTNSVSYSFKRSGNHMVEFWGHVLTGEVQYVCQYDYVRKKTVSKEQEYNNNNVKVIKTDYEIHYSGHTTFEHANVPIAPRINGEYLIAVSDKSKFIHILLFNRDDVLVRDLNTTISGYPHDIVETDYGFVLYAEYIDCFRSFLHLYNKKFELVNTVKVMDNNKTEAKNSPSTPDKQIMRYDSRGDADFGVEFMGNPSTGKLVYTKGRVYLIFGHYNYHSETNYHNGDTVATFNDLLMDLDFGETWGSSHTLLQSATFDDYFFVTAALSDPGLDVFYTSKTEYDMIWGYDAVEKRFNQRKHYLLKNLQGKMTGNGDGSTDARLGGILYFEKYKTYCIVYAKTPNYSNDNTNNTNIIYLTTWKLDNEKVPTKYTNKTIIVKKFAKDRNVLQVRVGKLGDDKIFIIYNETKIMKGYNWKVPAGTKLRVYIYQLPSLNLIKEDISNDKLYMNSNEDLRTFHDGVLIWGTADEEKKIVIHKIGTQRLDDSFDDIDYIITEDDLIDGNKKLSGWAIFGIVIGVIVGVVLLVLGIIILYRFIRKRRNADISDMKNIKGSLLR